MKKLFRLSMLLSLLLLLAVLILCAAAVKEATVTAIRLCISVLIPSLFPFCVLSGLFIRLGYGAATGRVFGAFMNRAFHLPACGASALILGLLGGYPIGAVTVSELYRRKELTRAQAEQLSSFCCNAGPAFIVGAVGLLLFGSVSAGLYLYAVHMLSAILTGLLLARDSCPQAASSPKQPPLPFLAAIRQSMAEACMSMLLICGFVVLFYILLELLFAVPAFNGLPLLWKGILSGFFELSGGVARLIGCDAHLCFPVVSALLGWGGICVHFQSLSSLTAADLSARPYLKGKLLQSFLSLLLTLPIAFF